MKRINVLLGLLLTAAIGIGTFVGYSFIKENKSVTVPDFLGKNKQEVFNWCGALDPEYSCTIEYEESSSTEEDLVFFQSINAGNKLKDNLTIKISTGIKETIKLPVIDSDTNKEEIENWIRDYSLTNVVFVEENSDKVKKGNIIRIDAPEKIEKDSNITVYVSKGSAEVERSIEVKSGEYINLTVAQFEAKAKELGLKPNHNSARDDYSNSVAEGKIVWHGSGTYVKDETINYGLSLGNKADKIIVDKGDYVGKTVAEFEEAVKKLTLNPYHDTEKDEYSDNVKKGTIVWHGSGIFEKDEKIRYGISLGKEGDTQGDDEDIIIKKGQYVGKTVTEFETAVKELKLVPNHDSDKDEYSDTVAKGNIVWHGSGYYEKNEKIRYGVSLGKEGDSQEDDEIIIKKGQYVGKTVSEFESTVKALKLDPYHDPGKDEYSETVTKGNIVWHGSGIYEQNERIRYGLSLGKQNTDGKVTVESGYEGKTESEFRQYIQGLGLVPNRSEELYSDTFAKGTVISYIAGEYNLGNSVSYKVSKGKQSDEPQQIVITKGQYVGKTVTEFENITKGLTLDPYHDSNKDEYSDAIPEGYIVWHGSGTYVNGEKIRYGLSLGPQPHEEESAYIMRPNYYEPGDTYQETKTKMQNYLSKFTNLIFEEVTSDLRVGQIAKITVNGNESYTAGNYPVSTPIKVYIVSKQNN